ncbi:MAG TPA: DUF4446 family protein [Candidatus Pacebacteria bacterium]|nr:DUF4446 family protein [Candidatus Paceibacterota bacterium]
MLDFYSSHQNLFAIFTLVTFALSLVTLIMAIIVTLRSRKLLNTTKTLFAGKKGADLEEVIVNHEKKLDCFDKEIQELFNISNTINAHSKSCLSKIGLVKFDPFGDRSGNQSFVIALLDSKDDGLILSTLHTREGTRIYTKQINKGEPINNELTKEELDALKQAQ